ncbi:hypothetical protein F4818DRAFT_445750 [Hypoxylon cercidicola]|nr:hypothetical protein F4818DRAFT_445750 [Hypoxylon cercidicola]
MLVPSSSIDVYAPYNTYLQQLCVEDAVAVESEDDSRSPVLKQYKSELVENYEKLARSLGITAGATITGWGQSGQVNVSYLDRGEHQGSANKKRTFKKVNTDNPIKVYGNRFVADFIRGGHFLARVSVTVNNSSQKEEIKQSTELAFSMYGADGSVTEEVEEALERIKKNSTIKISIFETTGTSKNSTAGYTVTETTDLLAVKERADEFFDNASSCQHKYVLFALLGKYTNLPDFENHFVPLDYSEASQRSWPLFDDFTMYQALETLVEAVPDKKYKNNVIKSKLREGVIDNVKKIRDRVLAISEHPDVSRHDPDHVPPTKFRRDILHAIMSTTFKVQSRPIQGDENWTDIISTTKYPDSVELFSFEAFDFDSIVGTRVISFGKRAGGEQAMVFTDAVDRFADQPYAVGRTASKNYVHVYPAEVGHPVKYESFRFFAPKPGAEY